MVTFLFRLVELAAAVVILVAAWFAVYHPDEFRAYFAVPAPRAAAPEAERGYTRVEQQVLETVQLNHAALQDASVAIEHMTRQLAATNAVVQDLSKSASAEDRDRANAVMSTNDALLNASSKVQQAVKASAVSAGAQADLAAKASGADEQVAVAALMQSAPGGSGETVTIEPRWGVVFGAELTDEAAKRMLSQAEASNSGLSMRLYRRNGFYRGVAVFPTHAAAAQELPTLRERVRPDSYVVPLMRWCPRPETENEVIECGG